MVNIKKPLITRIVGNRHACSLLIAIVFLFTGTGYTDSEPSKLRPPLQFNDMGKEAIERNSKPAGGITAELQDNLQALEDKR